MCNLLRIAIIPRFVQHRRAKEQQKNRKQTMVFGGIVTSPRGSLSTQQALELARVYLENACRAKDADIILVLCHDTEVSLSQAKRSAKHTDDQLERKRIGTVYIQLGKVLYSQGHSKEAQTSYKKAEKLGCVKFDRFIYP